MPSLLGTCLSQDDVTFTDIFALTALAGGMVAASCCLWYYSRRYVGEMALMLPDAQRVRFSVLDFWGNREVCAGQFIGGRAQEPTTCLVIPYHSDSDSCQQSQWQTRTSSGYLVAQQRSNNELSLEQYR